MIGQQLDKSQVNAIVGNTMRKMTQAMDEVKTLQAQLTSAAWTTTGLQAVGFTSDEATSLLAVVSAIESLRQCFDGEVAIGIGNHFRAMIAPACGLGI
jgi:hypothetical protein